jgi:predicted DNA-binding mobile mystery protein A
LYFHGMIGTKNLRNLSATHIEARLDAAKLIVDMPPMAGGWIRALRTALRIPLRRLAQVLGVSPQNVQEMEMREISGSITLKSMRQIAGAMDMEFHYFLFPKAKSLEKMIEKRAEVLAREIVLRTRQTMRLEDQDIGDEAVEAAIRAKADELKRTRPRYLWD